MEISTTIDAALSPGLSCRYTTEDVERLLDSESVLAVLGFDQQGPFHTRDPRYVETGLTQVGGGDLREVWYSSTPVSCGVEGEVRWASADGLLFVSMVVDEFRSPDHLQRASCRAYRRLLDLISARGCPHILRAWNYLADINAGEGDNERYKQFCAGRHRAFIEQGHDLSRFSAACALGHRGGPMVIYLLASREPGIHFENPQQVSAYRYPREYGARSPSFARATLKSWSESHHVYVSGTASILGHRSLHRGDVNRQLEVTFDNIDRLLLHIQNSAGLPQRLRPSLLKTYIRNRGDYPLIKSAVERQYGTDTPVIYVQADICRQELEVEIDGMCACPLTGV